MATLGEVFVQGIEALRAEVAKDPARARLWAQLPKDPRLPKATRLILDEIIQGVARDKLTKMDQQVFARSPAASSHAPRRWRP